MKKAIKYCLVVALGLVVAGCSKEESSAAKLNDNGDNGHKKVQLWKDGPYWSSVSVSDYDRHAWGLDFSSSFHDTCVNDRYYGQSVRPVQGFSK